MKLCVMQDFPYSIAFHAGYLLKERFRHVQRPRNLGRLSPCREDVLCQFGAGLWDGTLYPGLCVFTEAGLRRPSR